MDRLDILRRYAGKTKLGIEIAPYFNPIVTKAAGYNVLIVDVFDTETLRQRVLEDPNLTDDQAADVEAVDIVSDASDLITAVEARGIAGTIDYIVSSHNFEHLPNPIRFFKGVSAALRPGGTLTMAVPDHRACFDHFRMPTRLSDWLGAYHRDIRQPTPETRFDFITSVSSYMRDGQAAVGCDINVDDPSGFVPWKALRDAYAEYVADMDTPPPYKDAHCSAVCGASFELMARDLRHLGVIDLEIIEVVPTIGLEFFVHMRKPDVSTVAEDDATFYARREKLLRALNAQLGAAGFAWPKPPPPAVAVRSTARRIARRLLGARLYGRLATMRQRARARA